MGLAVFPPVDFHWWISMRLQGSNFAAWTSDLQNRAAHSHIHRVHLDLHTYKSLLLRVMREEMWLAVCVSNVVWAIWAWIADQEMWVPLWLCYWAVKASPLCACLPSCSSSAQCLACELSGAGTVSYFLFVQCFAQWISTMPVCRCSYKIWSR